MPTLSVKSKNAKMNYENNPSNYQWEWCEEKGQPYLTCTLLKHWKHGFFTKEVHGRSPSELAKIFNQEIESHQVKQVHGKTVLTPSQIQFTINDKGEKTLAEGDGIMSESENQCLWVASADCTPVLIADSQTGRVGAIHAGWRGTAQKIVPHAISLFLNHGSKIENLLFALGPAISGKVYQVGKEVAIEVGKSIVTTAEIREDVQLLQNLKEIPDSPVLEDSEQDKVKLDVRRVISLQLESLGVTKEQIAIAPYCTYQQTNYFFSYRRTGERKIQWSGIVSN
jgi:YfiH family protein